MLFIPIQVVFYYTPPQATYIILHALNIKYYGKYSSETFFLLLSSIFYCLQYCIGWVFHRSPLCYCWIFRLFPVSNYFQTTEWRFSDSFLHWTQLALRYTPRTVELQGLPHDLTCQLLSEVIVPCKRLQQSWGEGEAWDYKLCRQES